MSADFSADKNKCLVALPVQNDTISPHRLVHLIISYPTVQRYVKSH